MRYSSRTYNAATVCTFRSTKGRFGGLSNMAAGFPLVVGDVQARTSEALYQTFRFPQHVDVQAAILREASPMRAKMISRKHHALTRADWDRVRVPVMRWCLAVKLAQHFDVFGRILESTTGRDIVEESARDQFWGAMPSVEGTLTGTNALGRLLMELRARYQSPQRYTLLTVAPPYVPGAELLGEAIRPIDERERFLAYVRAIGAANVAASARITQPSLELPGA